MWDKNAPRPAILLHFCIQTLSTQKLDGGKAWEQGYRKHGIVLNDQQDRVGCVIDFE